MSGYPPLPFKVVGIEEFNVVPIVKDQIYTITDINEDGSRWQTRGLDGKYGWFPARMCEPLKKTTSPQNRPAPAPIQAPEKSAQPRQANTSQVIKNSQSPQPRQQPRQVEAQPEKRPVANTKPPAKTETQNVDDILANFKGFDDI
jgi:hypothetical protein